VLAPFARPHLEAELSDSLESRRLTLLVGPRGSGKTTLLERLLRLHAGLRPVALVQLEPIAASPEFLCRRLLDLAQEVISPAAEDLPPYARVLGSLAAGKPRAALLLDEVTELRTLSYFPGVERPLESFLEAASGAKAPAIVATSRFPTWTEALFSRLPRTLQERVSLRALPPLTAEEMERAGVRPAESLLAVTGGWPLHLPRLVEHMERGVELRDALEAEMTVGGLMEAECRAGFAHLLQQARGYGACKAALQVLAEEERLTLSEIARRMGRTPGSVRDYLWWLEEVELVRVCEKRFFFVDPVLRLWLRLYGRGRPPSPGELRSEVDRHLAERAPGHTVEAAPQGAFLSDDELIEID
jgi:energy-coupling factor transporter ATP-binding protein EcfA2